MASNNCFIDDDAIPTFQPSQLLFKIILFFSNFEQQRSLIMTFHTISFVLLLVWCTDGAPSMIGSSKGFVSLIKKVNSEIIATHYLIDLRASGLKATSAEAQERATRTATT